MQDLRAIYSPNLAGNRCGTVPSTPVRITPVGHAVPRTTSGLRHEHLCDLLLELLEGGGSSAVPAVHAQLEERQRRIEQQAWDRRANMRWLFTHPAHRRLHEDSALQRSVWAVQGLHRSGQSLVRAWTDQIRAVLAPPRRSFVCCRLPNRSGTAAGSGSKSRSAWAGGSKGPCCRSAVCCRPVACSCATAGLQQEP